MTSAADGTRVPVRVRDLKLVKGTKPDEAIREHGLVERCWHMCACGACANRCLRETMHNGPHVCGEPAHLDRLFVKPVDDALVGAMRVREERRRRTVRKYIYGTAVCTYASAAVWVGTALAPLLTNAQLGALLCTFVIFGVPLYVKATWTIADLDTRDDA